MFRSIGRAAPWAGWLTDCRGAGAGSIDLDLCGRQPLAQLAQLDVRLGCGWRRRFGAAVGAGGVMEVVHHGCRLRGVCA